MTSKKTGGITISHLRFGDHKIRSSLLCHQGRLTAPRSRIHHQGLQDGPRRQLPAAPSWSTASGMQRSLHHHPPAEAKRYIAKNINVYLINATGPCQVKLVYKRTNTILQSAFFALAKRSPRRRTSVHEGRCNSFLPEEGFLRTSSI